MSDEAQDQVERERAEAIKRFADVRETVRSTLSSLSSDTEAMRAAERAITMSMVVALMRGGFTFGMACEAIGAPESTVRGWSRSDKGFADALDGARETVRAWLIGELIQVLKAGGRAAGQAANILANLHFPELRSSKVENVHKGAPDPTRSRHNLDSITRRGLS